MTSPRSSQRPESGTAQPQSIATESHSPSSEPFPIVGIAASAGGLEAFMQLLKQLPGDTGMGFVLIQHLAPDHQSFLSQILARITQMPVCEGQTGITVEPNHVYVIPPNKEMTLVQGNLKLVPRDKKQVRPRPADAFFTSLAEDRGSSAIAVVLSGGDGDGTLGLEAIKAAGGITFAQCRHSARIDSMPKTAIATGQVDFILPPEEIAAELTKISRHPFINADFVKIAQAQFQGEDTIAALFKQLQSTTGLDFADYKPAMLQRQIKRRMVLYDFASLGDYVSYVRKNPAEAHQLSEGLLIGVTSFFRDPESFLALQDKVFPAITQGKPEDALLRIWVAGCATGEEAYSIAICCTEFLESITPQPAVRIFATDISDTAIAVARNGIYQPSRLLDVSAERLERFFVQVEGGYQVKQTIRRQCVFAKQNLIQDPPFSHVDLISCRNVLIYLSSNLQQQVIATLHHSLNPESFLMLGKSESVGSFSHLFTPIDQKYKIYRRNLAAAPALSRWA
jgi:two-component system, chemotaxis family, CheB/CheR fusion protein